MTIKARIEKLEAAEDAGAEVTLSELLTRIEDGTTDDPDFVRRCEKPELCRLITEAAGRSTPQTP